MKFAKLIVYLILLLGWAVLSLLAGVTIITLFILIEETDWGSFPSKMIDEISKL